MRRAGAPLAIVACALLVAGCGLKGPLKLPEAPGEVAVRPAPGTPAAAPGAPPASTSAPAPAPAPTPPPEPTEPPTGTSRE